MAPFFRQLWETADAQDIPLEGAISEFAPGQVELTLKHKPDALRAADDAVMYKRVAKGVRCRSASKPPSWPSRGPIVLARLPVHISVADKDGNISAPTTAPKARRCCTT